MPQSSVRDRVFEDYGIVLQPISASDLPLLRRWRNSPEIRRELVDTSYISPRQQRVWYEKVKDDRHQAHWVVRCKGVRAGYMNLKGDGVLEVQTTLHGGLYVGQSAVRHGLLGYAIAMMQLQISFDQLSANCYQTSFREENLSAKKFNEQLGYRETGMTDGFVTIEIYRPDYEETIKRFSRYFRR